MFLFVIAVSIPTISLFLIFITNWEISSYIEYIISGLTHGDMLLLVPQGEYVARLGESDKRNFLFTYLFPFSNLYSFDRSKKY